MIDDDMEKVRNILKISMVDLIKEIRVRDDAQVKTKKTDPTPIISFDHYISTYVQESSISKAEIIYPLDNVIPNAQEESSTNDKESNELQIASPRFQYDYGFNPLIYLADCIERNSKI